MIASTVSLSGMSGSMSAASPKSANPALLYASIKMLAGLTSRCSTPSKCAADKASAIRTPTSRTRRWLGRGSWVIHLVKRTAWTQFHDEEGPIVAQQTGVMDGDDAGVARHPARGTRLAQKASLLGVAVQFAFVDLDRDQPVQRLLAGFPDDREAAPGDRAPIRHTRNLRRNGGSHANQDSSDSAALTLRPPSLADNVRVRESQRLPRIT